VGSTTGLHIPSVAANLYESFVRAYLELFPPRADNVARMTAFQLSTEETSIMRISNTIHRALIASAGFATMGGCSGSGSPIASNPLRPAPSGVGQPVQQQILNSGRLDNILARSGSGHPVRTPSFFAPEAEAKPLIFVSDRTSYVVDICRQASKNKMVGPITGLNARRASITVRPDSWDVAATPPLVFITRITR
jgi:hypothetical protein